MLGFFINLSLIDYYEHGTYLTAAHAHASTFGAFGFLALGMVVYMFRSTVPGDRWSERRLRWSFWLLNAGLAVMVLLSVMPVGFLRLEAAFTQSYDTARNLAFYDSGPVQTLFWLRVPGDVMIILGALVFAVDVAAKLRDQRSLATDEQREARHPIADRVLAEDAAEPAAEPPEDDD